jgi:hypothetical protein
MISPQQALQLAARPLSISPLSLDTLTRDYYGSWDAYILAQLAALVDNDCYQPKIYRAPALSNELVAANGYTSFGLKITPGAIVYGLYLPPSSQTSNLPGQFNVQITDVSLKHDWFDQPIPSYFLANNKPSYLSASQSIVGSFPNLLDAPFPIVGRGLLEIQLWETSGAQQRIELPFGVLEPFGEACL